jgi:tRNA U34 5-carboxymethylaminomethyl modifying GTPase MnmE/TrmE
MALLEQAHECLSRAENALIDTSTPEEFLLADLHAARARFDEVVGVRTSEDVLTHIFETFCIGK